jgi:hypothetical protein
MLPEMFLSRRCCRSCLPGRWTGNPQAWYAGSAVDQNVHEDGVVFARARDRGLRGEGALAYFEWSATDDPDLTPNQAEDLLDDVEAWRRANPALGYPDF